MNKIEFIELVNNAVAVPENADIKGKLTKAEVERMIDVVINSMKQAVYDSGELNIRGFGTFSVTEQAARVGRNPKTGEKIDVPAKRKLHFKTSPAIIEKLNDK